MRFARILACLSLAWLIAVPASVMARPALVIDASSGEVLHANEATALWYPASVTKVMTAYVALSAVRAGRRSLNSELIVSERALAAPPSKVGMPVGSTLTLEQALGIIMVKSANDTAIAIAEGIGGSVETFVAEMNRTAARLGMRDTRYANPNGLPDRSQVTTARDQAILAQAIYRDFGQYRRFYGMENIKVGKRTFKNYNSLIGKYPGADGLKTGFICDSGFNLVASARRNGRHLIAVVFGAEDSGEREEIVTELLDRGFASRRGLFAARRETVRSLPSTRRGALVMRQHVCGPTKQRVPIPQQIASYGVSRSPLAVAIDPARGGRARASALVFTGVQTPADEGDRNGTADVAVRFVTVPIPAPNPRR